MELKSVGAIVTGGASGLGEATARELTAAGARVLIADLNVERGEALAAELGGVFARTDVSNQDDVLAAVAATGDLGVPLRVVVNSAGVGWAERTVNRDGSPHDLARYRKVIEINLLGTFAVTSTAAAAIGRTEPVNSDGLRGVVINTASIAGLEGQTGQVAYASSKGGIIGMTIPAARDLAALGIRVNTICPGIIDTPIYGSGPEAEERKAGLAKPVVFPKRMGRASEFGHLVRALVENDYVNAEVIRFDGGIRFQPK